jgi:hypothetical protein
MNNNKYLKTAFLLTAMTVITTNGSDAQENTSKSYSIGPAIEFSDGSTSFGLKAKIGVGSQFSVRPTLLLGYTNDFQKSLNAGGRDILGAAIGAGFTYDFDLADKKFNAYVGPRALFSSGSETVSDGIQSASLNYSQTDIGLLVGGDYTISDNFTAGVSVVYNFARNYNATTITPTGRQDVNATFNNNNFDFGINFAYRF